SEVRVLPQTDIFGNETLFSLGYLTNTSSSAAYNNITLTAEMYDKNNELVGEGFGYPVDECGTALGTLEDFTLQPGESQEFSIPLELYEEDAEYERVEIIPQAAATEAETASAALQGIKQVINYEVVALEWIDDASLRFGVGCDTDIFTTYDWYEYGINNERIFLTSHLKAEFVTDAMLTQTGLTDPALLRHSYLSFHPDDQRMVYQNDLNTIITAERDGSFKRIVAEDLSRVSLHGFLWLPDDLFLAYYYGAYGDPVRYFTANMSGQRLSANVYEVIPSQTIPGVTSNGTKFIIGATIDDQTGYFLTSGKSGVTQLLFEAELPGNNYPAPLYVDKTERGQDNDACIYIVHDVNGKAWLDQYNLLAQELVPLTALPLHLNTDNRAWTWLSPDHSTIALAANGQFGGLWLIDLQHFGVCGAPTS
ncbi:MAG TPA: hypothetical protein VHL11_05520, partial [Phototrophicaceae bacterium]|nr:hypothetical protein [Phototrophicaceae bacterium]